MILEGEVTKDTIDGKEIGSTFPFAAEALAGFHLSISSKLLLGA